MWRRKGQGLGGVRRFLYPSPAFTTTAQAPGYSITQIWMDGVKTKDTVCKNCIGSRITNI